jgi:hypothetical protein
MRLPSLWWVAAYGPVQFAGIDLYMRPALPKRPFNLRPQLGPELICVRHRLVLCFRAAYGVGTPGATPLQKNQAPNRRACSA